MTQVVVTETAKPNASMFQELSDRGFSLVPMDGKRPIEDNWTKARSERRRYDPMVFRDRNAGIVCGPASGVLGVDVDNPRLFASVCRRLKWTIPETFTVRSGRGYHLYFKYPTSGGDYGNLSSKVLGFDVRGKGGALVAPGSIHPKTGKEYTIQNDIPLADPPEWLLQFYSRRTDGITAIDEKKLLRELPPEIAEFLNTTPDASEFMEPASKLIEALVRKGLSDHQIFSVFYTWPIGKCLNPDKHDAWIEKALKETRGRLGSPSDMISSICDSMIQNLSVSEAIKETIRDGAPEGSRSEAMQRVLNALVSAGVEDAMIVQIFDRYPIGEKYREKGSTMNNWLQVQIEKARQYVSENPSEFPPQKKPDNGSSCFAGLDLGALSVERLLNTEPEPTRWFLKGSLPLGSLGVLASDGGVGKSFLLLQLGLATALTAQFLNYEVAKGKAVLLFGEDSESVIHHRLRDLLRPSYESGAIQAIESFIKENLYITSLAGKSATLIEPTREGMRTKSAFDDLLKLLKGVSDLKLVVLDPLSRFFSGNENDSNQMSRFAELLERIAVETGATVIISQHTGKASNGQYAKGNDPLKYGAIRGSTALTNAARWQMNLRYPDDKELKKLGISEEDARFYVFGRVTKKNVGKPEDRFLLKRDEETGELRLWDTSKLQGGSDEIEEAVIRKIAELQEAGMPATKRGFSREYGKEWWKDHGTTKLERLIDRLVSEDRISLVNSKNKQGREVVYLHVNRVQS
jgi:archaellum biogenesis ATPase FlaH